MSSPAFTEAPSFTSIASTVLAPLDDMIVGDCSFSAGGAPAKRLGLSILDAEYLSQLRKLNDELFALPGVVRGQMRSLWTPSTRWTAVTESGFEGGTVMPDNYDGSSSALARVRLNIERSGEVGQLVAKDFQSSALIVPLAEKDPDTGRSLDYAQLSERLEIRRRDLQVFDVQGHGIRPFSNFDRARRRLRDRRRICRRRVHARADRMRRRRR